MKIKNQKGFCPFTLAAIISASLFGVAMVTDTAREIADSKVRNEQQRSEVTLPLSPTPPPKPLTLEQSKLDFECRLQSGVWAFCTGEVRKIEGIK